MAIRISENLERRRFELDRRIRKAFKGVSRRGGASWSMAEAIDGYRSSEEIYAAGARDKDKCWEDVLEDKSWTPESGIGGWVFLDNIGRRYYLPAGMIRSMYQSDVVGLEWAISNIEGLSPDQHAAVAAFVLWMRDHDNWLYTQARTERPGLPRANPCSNPWQELLDRYWHAFL